MKTCGIFTTHQFRIPFNKYGEPIYLYPFGDIHWNSPACDRGKFIDWCDSVRTEKNAYFLGIGDYMETLASSERKAYLEACFHDSSGETIEAHVRRDTKEFIDQIGFMKNKTIGIVGGNHYFQFSDGDSTDLYISRELKTRFLGVNSLIRLYLCYDQHHVHKIDICIHHGLSGGRTSGASINKLQTMANSFDADIILQGHDHNRAVDYINRLGLTDTRRGEPKLTNRRILLARTGSFLKGYEENRPSYVVESALNPTDLGVVRIIVTPKRVDNHVVDLRWVDIEARI